MGIDPKLCINGVCGLPVAAVSIMPLIASSMIDAAIILGEKPVGMCKKSLNDY
jgi:hypothetical protein